MRKPVGALTPSLLGVAFCAALALGRQPVARVSISGGADESGYNYTWTVSNHASSPIVRVEFPHYHAHFFFVPDGWSSVTTNLFKAGQAAKTGICVGNADSDATAIHPGQSATFRMRIGPMRASRGRGSVRVDFADDSHVYVADVMVPVAESTGAKYAPLIGLGAIFAILLVAQVFRRRRRRFSTTARSSDAG